MGAAVAQRRSQLVLGLDPDPARLWPVAQVAPQVGADPAVAAAAAVAAHCAAVIDAAGSACVAVKLQLACFERLGGPGWQALGEAARCAREAGLLVIADGKRGDVPVTAAAYGQAMVGTTPTPFGEVAGLGADAFTANPFLGGDTLAPLVDAARGQGAGVFVLVRTSNPGAADLQDLPTLDSDGQTAPLWERLAVRVAALGSGVGAVVGATVPEHLQRLRTLMPRTVFLLPGVGAQGARVQDLGPAFAPGPASGLVAVSRGIVAAHERYGGEPARAAEAEAERLRAAVAAVAAEGP
ncbi:MAG: orotidine-5'-phosphate decarboxylase [Actinomycetota bacterium]|nr:orotidine-5'-phosphate decarboxylase [Actinomycetota bacterium]